MEIFLWGDNCYCHFTTSLVSTTELLSQWGDKPSHKVHCPSQNGNYLASLKHSLQYHNPISPLQLVKHSIFLCDARSTIKSDYGSWKTIHFMVKASSDVIIQHWCCITTPVIFCRVLFLWTSWAIDILTKHLASALSNLVIHSLREKITFAQNTSTQTQWHLLRRWRSKKPIRGANEA